jgi:8-oxo-dGTP pyrophosphatase MutT (NUDIX family)
MKKRGPWTVLSEELKLETPWITVSRHEVVDPGGQEGEYGVIHFKNLAVGVLPLDAENNTWIVGQYRYPLEKYSWEIPEGGGLRHIEPLESAKRELKEETGLVADKWTEILRMDLSNSASDEHAILYLAEGLVQGESEPDSNEELEVRKIPFEDLYQLVLHGEILDSLTVAAVLRVRLMMQEGLIQK